MLLWYDDVRWYDIICYEVVSSRYVSQSSRFNSNTDSCHGPHHLYLTTYLPTYLGIYLLPCSIQICDQCCHRCCSFRQRRMDARARRKHRKGCDWQQGRAGWRGTPPAAIIPTTTTITTTITTLDAMAQLARSVRQSGGNGAIVGIPWSMAWSSRDDHYGRSTGSGLLGFITIPNTTKNERKQRKLPQQLGELWVHHIYLKE